jgi:predicted ATPase
MSFVVSRMTTFEIPVTSERSRARRSASKIVYASLPATDAARVQPVADRVDLFVSTVNRYLADKKLEFTPTRGLRLLPPGYSADPVPLEPSQLSSGERHLLLLFGSALIAEGRRLILIDEPELSLGISWKRMLLRSLLDLTGDSEAQFLIASHSVEIISPFQENALELRAAAGPRRP